MVRCIGREGCPAVCSDLISPCYFIAAFVISLVVKSYEDFQAAVNRDIHLSRDY